jgi:hypothetical protein
VIGTREAFDVDSRRDVHFGDLESGTGSLTQKRTCPAFVPPLSFPAGSLDTALPLNAASSGRIVQCVEWPCKPCCVR